MTLLTSNSTTHQEELAAKREQARKRQQKHRDKKSNEIKDHVTREKSNEIKDRVTGDAGVDPIEKFPTKVRSFEELGTTLGGAKHLPKRGKLDEVSRTKERFDR